MMTFEWREGRRGCLQWKGRAGQAVWMDKHAGTHSRTHATGGPIWGGAQPSPGDGEGGNSSSSNGGGDGSNNYGKPFFITLRA